MVSAICGYCGRTFPLVDGERYVRITVEDATGNASLRYVCHDCDAERGLSEIVDELTAERRDPA